MIITLPPVLCEFKPGDLVEHSELNAKRFPIYSAKCGVGKVTKLTPTRVVVQWPSHVRRRSYKPQHLKKHTSNQEAPPQ